MLKFNCIERPLSAFFYRYGKFVTTRPAPFIIFPIIVFLALSTGIFRIKKITDVIYLFTPQGAPSKIERQILHELWPLINGSYIPGRAVTQSREVQLIVHTTDNGNILKKPYSDAVIDLNIYIKEKIYVKYKNDTYHYKNLCLSNYYDQKCFENNHTHLISILHQSGLNLSYPILSIGDARGYIGSSLGGVKVFYSKNNSMVLASAKAWLIVYHLQFFPPEISYISGLWEKAFEKAMKEYKPMPNIATTFFHSQTLAEELKRNSDSLIPRFTLAFAILTCFCIVCNMSFCDGTWYIDWVLSKPIISIFGIFNAGMGICTGIGFLVWLGFPYNDIVGVMPFLIVAVGVDNMFLMIAAIRRTNRAIEVSERVGKAMSDAAVSMFITSLTDIFSFGVGCITTIPAVQLFCIYTCAAVTFTFLFQLTFFAAILAISIKWESMNFHCIFLKPTIDACLVKNVNQWNRWFWLGSQRDLDITNVEKNLKNSGAAIFFKNWFAPILMNPFISGISIAWYCIYFGIAVYGCLQIREGLEPVNLLVEDSYAIPHYRALEKYFWQYGPTLQVVVNNVPNMMDPLERESLKKMAYDFANTRHTIGDSLQFWLLEVERYYQHVFGENMTLVSDKFYSLVSHFFDKKKTEFWPNDVKWVHSSNNNVSIKSFRFFVGLRKISTSVDQMNATMEMRKLAERYSKYNITTFMPLWLFTDQYALIIPNTVQNIVIAMIVMIIIALLLIPEPTCAIWVALAIASIDFGVIGYMTLWGDAISMITIIMSIGFSVDYSAHITYGYVISQEKSSSDRVRSALGVLGWPLTQGAISTILAVSVLANVPSYMIITFFKTVFLAISIGLLHGLIFLPVALSIFVRIKKD